jgi:phosphate transport system permease protein
MSQTTDVRAPIPHPGGVLPPGGFSGPGGGAGSVAERPNRRPRVVPAVVWEMGGSAVAALAFVWVVFSVSGTSALLGLFVSWFLTFVTVYAVLCWRLHGILVMKDRLATVGMWTGALTALVPLLAVIIFVVIRGAPVALDHFPHFFYADMLKVGAGNPVTSVGAGAAIVGTVEQVGLAALMTVPLGVLTATYLVDSPGPFARLVSYVVDAMTGAPAIIAAVFVYLIWVAPLRHNGQSGFAAALALSVMMLPVVTRASQEVIAVVPGALREAALALGAPRWRVVLRVVLPTARAGLVTAVILGVARVAGETAPVLFAAGGNVYYNWNPFHGQQDNLPLRIYELIGQGSGNITKDAWGVSFVLVLLVLGLFVLARLAGRSNPGRRTLRGRRRSPTGART